MLHALGQCLIRTGIATIAPRAELGFALATRLIADRGRRLSRRYLTALFWPDIEEQKAAHSLSEALHRLRARGLPIQSDSTHAVWLERDAATLDVDRIPDTPPAVLAKCDFTVLPGFEPRGTPALLDWTDEFRHHLAIQTVRNLAPAITRAEHEGDWASALTLAEHALKLDAGDSTALDARARAALRLSTQRTAPARGRGAPSGAAPAELRATGGVREPAPVACDLRQRTSAPPNCTFVGRDDELGLLRDAWHSAMRGRGRRVLIYGRSGIGKTCLVRQLRTAIRQSGGVTADVQSDPGDASRPLAAFLRLVPKLRSLPGAAAISPDLRPYLDRLTEFDGASSPWPDPADTPYILSCIERAIDELIDSVADEQPLLLVFDNAQWADAHSRRLLDGLALSIASRAVLVVVVSCEKDDSLLSASCPAVIPLEVGALPDQIARQLVLDRIQSACRGADEALVRWLVTAGEGNPLRLEEITTHWVHGGAPFELPPTIGAVLKARVAELSSNDRHVLQAVALLGQQATIARVQRVVGLNQAALFDALDALGRNRLLDVDEVGQCGGLIADGAAIRCRHDAVADAAISQLSAPGRAVLHRTIALELERTASASAEVLWERVAHWNGGAEPADAARTTVNCARHLAAVGLADAGAAACRHMLDEPLPNATRRHVLAALVHTLQHGWRWHDVLETARELRSLDSSIAQHDDVELCILDARWQLQRAPEETLAQSIECASAGDASAAHRVSAAAIAIKLATNTGNLARLHEAYHAVSSSLSESGIDPAERITVGMMYHAIGGSLPLAATYARELMRRSADLAEPARLRALVNCASALARAGEVTDALRICEGACHDAISRRLSPIAAAACHRAANIALDCGAVEPARLWTERFAAHVAPDDARRQRAVCLARARLALHDGDFPTVALLLLPEGSPLWADATPAFAATSLATAIAGVTQERGCAKRLRSLLAAALPLHRRLQDMGAHDFVACALASGYWSLGESARAKLLMDSYLTRHRRELTPFPERFAAMIEQAKTQSSS